MQIQLQPANPPGLFRHHGEESTKVNSTSYAQQGCCTVGQGCQKCKETSSLLADKEQKTGEHVEDIKLS